MNKSTIKRSEEARREAQAALTQAKRRQDALLQERAAMHANEVQKVDNLRAQRLANREQASSAGDIIARRDQARRKRLLPAA